MAGHALGHRDDLVLAAVHHLTARHRRRGAPGPRREGLRGQAPLRPYVRYLKNIKLKGVEMVS